MVDSQLLDQLLRSQLPSTYSYRQMVKDVELMRPQQLTEVRSQFPYKMPKTHIDWATLSALIVMSIQPHGSDIDRATDCHNGLWKAWLRTRSPIYCLSTELLRQFQATDAIDLPGLVPGDWVPPLPVFCLALPNSAVMSPMGYECPYVMVSLHHPEIPNCIPSEHPRQISVATCDRNGTVWMSGVGFDGTGFTRTRRELGTSKTDEAEHEWLQGLVSLALQCAMALSYLPELLDEEPHLAPSSQKRSRPHDKPATLHPRWIGRGFKRSATRSNGGQHSSPRTHLRRGHWRSQAVGPGRVDRRLTWVRPAMVN